MVRDGDKVTIVGAGVTLHEAVQAHETLKAEGIEIKVIDPFTLKPVDKDLLIQSARATGGRMITVEDHYPEGRVQHIYLFVIVLLTVSPHRWSW